MVAYVICGDCGRGYRPQEQAHSCSRTTRSMAQLSQAEKPVLWIHPVTGEIKYPMENSHEMPTRYKDQGYERKEFNSYHEHQSFCHQHGLVNHKAEGVSVDRDAQLSRWGY